MCPSLVLAIHSPLWDEMFQNLVQVSFDVLTSDSQNHYVLGKCLTEAHSLEESAVYLENCHPVRERLH